MKFIMEQWRKYVKEAAQWGGFSGGAAPLDEPVRDTGPVPKEQLRKMWDIYIDMGMSPEEILQTPEFVEAGVTSLEQLQEAIALDIEVGDIILGGPGKRGLVLVEAGTGLGHSLWGNSVSLRHIIWMS